MKLFTMISVGILLLSKLAVAEGVYAELCMIGLGAKPARGYSESGAMLIAPVGTVPPSRLYYRSSKGDDEWNVINLTFNNSSAMVRIPAEDDIQFYQKEGEAYEEYVRLAALAKGERRVVFLTPSTPGKQAWNSGVNQHSLLLDSNEVKGAQVVMKNLSSAGLQCQMGKKEEGLLPMETIYHDQAEEGLCRISARYGAEARVVYNSAVRLSHAGSKYLYAFYDAEPRTNAGSAVGVFRMIFSEADQEQKKSPKP